MGGVLTLGCVLAQSRPDGIEVLEDILDHDVVYDLDDLDEDSEVHLRTLHLHGILHHRHSRSQSE